ncbi:sensor histidine kinase [Nocardioides donggukensis]|uniref:sensor histidine kinase n=1 Tax=Nocardioides donggukensis TaxID=2774019 RepID=UPI00298BF04C|nr:HAMP domain-containing sensor histidine kinase [Nocardioides donggukensis]
MSLSTGDQLDIVVVVSAWAGGTGAVALVVAWFLRRRSVRVLTAFVALVAVAAVVAGTVGTARAMFLSAHDFEVVLLVAGVSGVVALLLALTVAAAFGHWSRTLRAEAVRFGESGTFVSDPGLPADLRELSEELARTGERLQESRSRELRLEESRRELVSWVSHDLRSPLAALRAMTEALEDGLAEDPERYHRQIRAEVDRMVRMVDDLFELSRIHAGVLQLSLQPVAVGDIVSEALAAADPVARARGVRLGGSVSEGLQVTADPAGLSRVVSNLVLNAIRHTPADGVVEVHGRDAGSGVELAVTDGCGGIPEEDLPRLFDVAWQGDAARTPHAPQPTQPTQPAQAQSGQPGERGAGLGLAIVKGLVEAHRGQVAVANAEPGCRFVVRLPASAPDPAL